MSKFTTNLKDSFFIATKESIKFLAPVTFIASSILFTDPTWIETIKDAFFHAAVATLGGTLGGTLSGAFNKDRCKNKIEKKLVLGMALGTLLSLSPFIYEEFTQQKGSSDPIIQNDLQQYGPQ